MIKRSVKERAAQRNWTIPSNIHNLDETFAIDRVIKQILGGTSKIQPFAHWTKARTKALRLGRAALEMAIASAQHEVERAKHEPINRDHSSAQRSCASEALKCLDRTLMVVLKGKGSPEALAAGMRITSHWKCIQMGQPCEVSDVDKRSEAFAQALAAAKEVLSVLIEEAKYRLRRDRINPGDPAKREFILIMMEFWIVLTGKKPSLKKNNDSRYPFGRLMTAAFIDADQFDEDENFEAATRSARKSISPSRMELLRTQGPAWVRNPTP